MKVHGPKCPVLYCCQTVLREAVLNIIIIIDMMLYNGSKVSSSTDKICGLCPKHKHA